MRHHLVTLGLAVFFAAQVSGPAAAQNPYADFNRMRAYRHFLTSPYPVRTYSGQLPGYSYGYVTPSGYGRFWQPPGYLHQRISPRGFESYALVPPARGYAVTTAPLPPPVPVPPPAPPAQPVVPALPPADEPSAPDAVPPLVPDEDGPSYPYDGGPRNPVPMPGSQQAAPVPSALSRSAGSRRWAYPAYGEDRAERRVAGLRRAGGR